MINIMNIPPEELGRGSAVKVEILLEPKDLYEDFARVLAGKIQDNNAKGKITTAILPVGPTKQYPLLAEICAAEKIDCRRLFTFNMDEYCFEDGSAVPADHPMSFEGFMEREFFSLLPEELRPPKRQRVFPDPQNTAAIGRKIEQCGGVDICFGGIGINGHIAFNEAPEPDDPIADDVFRDLPTRVLSIARETRVINAVFGSGGDLDAIPPKCVTIGMREILASRECRFYCDWPWQRAVIRKAVHGPVAARFPASFLQRHTNATIIASAGAAALPGGKPE